MVSVDRISRFHELRRGLFFVCRIGDIRVIRVKCLRASRRRSSCGPRLQVIVLSLGKKLLLLREAALIGDSPGRLKRLEPTQAIKAGYC